MRGSVRTLSPVFALTLATGIALAGGAAQAAKFKVLVSFAHKLGINPMAPVLIDQAGNLYTTASQGGAQGGGTAVELKRKGGGYKATAIFRFCGGCGTGAQPSGRLIIDTQGNLYGTAGNLIFELSPVVGQKTWGEKILYRFCSQLNCTDGNDPGGGLAYAGQASGAPYDGVSPLFGVTSSGGVNNGGTAFEIKNDAGKWSESVLYSFCAQGGAKCTDGNSPQTGVTVDSSGNIYGVTKLGGGNDPVLSGAGVVFELSPAGNDSWTETTLYRFCSLQDCIDGARPWAGLTLDSSGALLGTTLLGGRKCPLTPDRCGVIFKLVPNGAQSQETVLYDFCKKADCKDGAIPMAGVSLGNDGSLFGTTNLGGGNDGSAFPNGGGTVFQFSESSLSTLHSFCSLVNCEDGAAPAATPIVESTGALYGTTESGGVSDSGTVFRLVQ